MNRRVRRARPPWCGAMHAAAGARRPVSRAATTSGWRAWIACDVSKRGEGAAERRASELGGIDCVVAEYGPLTSSPSTSSR